MAAALHGLRAAQEGDYGAQAGARCAICRTQPPGGEWGGRRGRRVPVTRPRHPASDVWPRGGVTGVGICVGWRWWAATRVVVAGGWPGAAAAATRGGRGHTGRAESAARHGRDRGSAPAGRWPCGGGRRWRRQARRGRHWLSRCEHRGRKARGLSALCVQAGPRGARHSRTPQPPRRRPRWRR